MKIEKSRKNSNFKKIIVSGVGVVAVLSIGILATGIAKYQNMKSVNIAKENIVAVYVESEDGNYSKVSDGKIPASGYTLNTDNTKTRCTVSGEMDSNVRISYENGEIKVGGVTKSRTRCYFYFDKVKGITIDEVIAGGTPTDDSIFSGTNGDGVYTWTKGDYSGGDKPIKYYRGNVNNNWVVFGKDGDQYIWWRIIRSNSNGSLRMIYAGLSANKNVAPATTSDKTGIGYNLFNPSNDMNMYVGFKYTNNEVHGTITNSTILGEDNSTDKLTLYGWYNTTLGTSSNYSDKIDINAGFCNDRNPSTSTSSINGSGGTGKTTTYYAGKIRLERNKLPSLLCTNNKDIFKTPIGLITADEVQMGGMVVDSPDNTNSYLYTKEYYWTMTPYYYNGPASGAAVFIVQSNGSLFYKDVDISIEYRSISIRPVINLKKDIFFEKGGTGTSTDPYIVSGT